MGMRWIAMLPGAPAAVRVGNKPTQPRRCPGPGSVPNTGLPDLILEIRQTQDLGASGREARRCTGTTRIGVILPGSGPNSCVEAQAEIDCAGHVQITHRFGEGPDFCPTANVAWKTYCLETPPWAPASGTAPAPAPGGTTTATRSA
jgi:hypothetical protein